MVSLKRTFRLLFLTRYSILFGLAGPVLIPAAALAVPDLLGSFLVLGRSAVVQRHAVAIVGAVRVGELSLDSGERGGRGFLIFGKVTDSASPHPRSTRSLRV